MGRAPTGRPTSFDIAYRAGVSQPTVSRALRGDRSVSEATRNRIIEIATELKYIVDKNASSLRSQRSNTIALLFFEDQTPDESNINPFFLAMLGSITRACANRGLDLLISFQKMEDNWHTRYQMSHRADGLILLGYGDYSLYASQLAKLTEQGTHYARWGSVCSDDSGATMGSDNLGAGRQVAEHLIAGGCRNIAFIGDASASYPEFARRYEGLCQAMREAGIEPDPDLQHDALTSEEDGYRATAALLARGKPFDAIFAASDLIAIGAMRALNEAGKAIPEDCAVVGFDNIPAAGLTSPPLTTIMQDIKGAGEGLVETVLAQIDGRQPLVSRLETRLIVRGSTRRV